MLKLFRARSLIVNEFHVKAHWDEEAKVWWGESDDIPGLCVEAFTFEELENRLSDLIPDFLILNHIMEETDNKPVPIRLTPMPLDVVFSRAKPEKTTYR